MRHFQVYSVLSYCSQCYIPTLENGGLVQTSPPMITGPAWNYGRLHLQKRRYREYELLGRTMLVSHNEVLRGGMLPHELCHIGREWTSGCAGVTSWGVNISIVDPALFDWNCLPSRFLRITGIKQPRIVRWLGFTTHLWHVVVPVIDDATDVLLLTSTADSAGLLWWTCSIALVIADIERLWLFFTLCLTVGLLPFLWLFDLYASSDWGRTAAAVFALLNCRVEFPLPTFGNRLKDSLLWILVGSRSRCSPLWQALGMGLDVNVKEADRVGVGFGAIDKWVARHPFSFLGHDLFGKGFELKGGDDGASRRARVLIRAVGETLVVDTIFLALSVVSGGWDGNLTGVAAVSALFSVLELLTELQYYVAEAGAALEPVSSSDIIAVSGSAEDAVVADPPTADLEASVPTLGDVAPPI